MPIPEPWLIKVIIVITLVVWAFLTHVEYRTTVWPSGSTFGNLLGCIVWAAFQIIIVAAVLLILGGAVLYLFWY